MQPTAISWISLGACTLGSIIGVFAMGAGLVEASPGQRIPHVLVAAGALLTAMSFVGAIVVVDTSSPAGSGVRTFGPGPAAPASAPIREPTPSSAPTTTTSDAPPTGAITSAPITTEIRVVIDGFRFNPARIELRIGEPVVIVVENHTTFGHTFTVTGLGFELRVGAGASVRGELTGSAPGTYEFICAIPGHAAAGMRGTVQVG